jgi:hypothetical protein
MFQRVALYLTVGSIMLELQGCGPACTEEALNECLDMTANPVDDCPGVQANVDCMANCDCETDINTLGVEEFEGAPDGMTLKDLLKMGNAANKALDCEVTHHC